VIAGFHRKVDDTCALQVYYRTDVSGQTISPFFKGQEIQEFFTLEDGKDRLFRNVGEDYHHTLHNIPEERGFLLSHYSVHIGYMFSTFLSRQLTNLMHNIFVLQ